MALFVGSLKKSIQGWSCLFAVSICLLGILISCSKSDSPAEILPSAESEIYFSKSVDFTSDSGEKAVTFTTNKDWKIELSQSGGDANWCSVSPMEGKAGTNTVKIKTIANTTYDDRNMTLSLIVEELTKKIVVTQKQKDALTLTTAKYEVGVEGGTIQVEVKANVNYEVQIPEQYAGWIHRVAGTRGLSSSTVSFTIDKSEEYDKREGEIIIKSGEMSESLKVYQAGSAVLLLTENEYTLSDEGGQITVELNSNFEYEVQMPQVEWITATTTRGVSSHTLHYSIAPNSTYDIREAEIVYYDKNSDIKESLKITQAQKDAIVISKKEYEIGAVGGTIQVEVKANIDYEVQIPEQYAGWIHRAAGTRGLSSSTVSFTIDKSEEYDKREGEIIIKSGEMSESLKVYQAGSAVLLLTENEYTLSDKGGQITVELNSNFEYEVQMPQVEWITATTTRGISSHTLHYTIAPNNTFDSRTAEIVYYDKNSTAKAVVKVSQNPLILALEESEVELMVGSGKQLTYKLNPIAGSDNLVWNSSDVGVVTVSRNGTLTAVKKGSAIITVATSDGLHKASCTVTVKAIEDYISFSISSSIISVGGYINKSVSSTIKNQSKGSIQLVKLTAKHPVTMAVISTTTDASSLGILKPGESKSLTLNNLREDITPIFIWEYIFEGNRYANHELIGGVGTDTPGGTVDDMPWN